MMQCGVNPPRHIRCNRVEYFERGIMKASCALAFSATALLQQRVDGFISGAIRLQSSVGTRVCAGRRLCMSGEMAATIAMCCGPSWQLCCNFPSRFWGRMNRMLIIEPEHWEKSDRKTRTGRM